MTCLQRFCDLHDDVCFVIFTRLAQAQRPIRLLQILIRCRRVVLLRFTPNIENMHPLNNYFTLLLVPGSSQLVYGLPTSSLGCVVQVLCPRLLSPCLMDNLSEVVAQWPKTGVPDVFPSISGCTKYKGGRECSRPYVIDQRPFSPGSGQNRQGAPDLPYVCQLPPGFSHIMLPSSGLLEHASLDYNNNNCNIPRLSCEVE